MLMNYVLNPCSSESHFYGNLKDIQLFFITYFLKFLISVVLSFFFADKSNTQELLKWIQVVSIFNTFMNHSSSCGTLKTHNRHLDVTKSWKLICILQQQQQQQKCLYFR